MRKLSALTILCSVMALLPATALASDPPVVVELFTAQGCSACPDANQNVARMANDPKVIVLTYGVDYWDYLGWPDTFARPEFSQRQRAYRQALGLRSLATPQIVISGQQTIEQARPEDLAEAIAVQNRKTDWPPEIEFRETGDRVGVGSGRTPDGGAEVVAIRYLPGVHNVRVRAGDNRGRSVSHVNVVREIHSLGDWNGRSSLYQLPPQFTRASTRGEAVLVMLQSKADRRIIAAASLPELRHD
ncbi:MULTISPECIES: DUF1223 domain-containing protein [unclassified Brevundimonas]|uniref:DUF1223 domain-containing protein n=1 Tax=unclassified Brevundimonas TaxID=2622653 RepID=UPI0025C44702|nr:MULTISPECIES: DUF1223 domain-containing protein [unclassified Brevundimonas]